MKIPFITGIHSSGRLRKHAAYISMRVKIEIQWKLVKNSYIRPAPLRWPSVSSRWYTSFHLVSSSLYRFSLPFFTWHEIEPYEIRIRSKGKRIKKSRTIHRARSREKNTFASKYSRSLDGFRNAWLVRVFSELGGRKRRKGIQSSGFL